MGAHISIPIYQASIDQRLNFAAERCLECGALNFPPKAVCLECERGTEFEAVELSGDGEVYSYTVTSPGAAPPEFAGQAEAEGEYVVAIVELEEGPRITGQVVDIDPESVEIGLPVEGRIRRIYEEEGVVRYGFKFVPRTDAEESA